MHRRALIMVETHVVLVVLVGLPGVGKSTVCKKLSFYLNGKCEGQKVECIHVCYDDLIPLSAQEKYVQLKQCGEESHSENENWKTARRNVYYKVDKLVECLKIRCLNDFAFSFFNLSNKIVEKDALYVVLLDDNFYYRSMRYEYFQLARKHTVGFCQLYIECSTEVAVQQNMEREAHVPTAVVKAMAGKLQPPLPSEHSWESTTYILQADKLEESHSTWNMIYKCFMSPVPQIEDRELEVAESRLECSRSVAHQADIYLRSLVGQVIKESLSKGNMTSGELSVLSRTVNAGRQSLLAAVRSGTLLFPPNIAKVVNDSNREEFQCILEYELRKKLRD